MVIADFNIKSIAIFKPKADAPLIINGYGMLPFTIICEHVQLVSWRHFKIIKTSRQIYILQLPGNPLVNKHKEGQVQNQ